jgi:hypothetical protein
MKISESVKDYLLAGRAREASSKDLKFYLSDMGKCLRVRWIKRKGMTAEFEPYVNWIFQIGDLYHDFVYKALESKGILLKSEDYVSNDHFVGRYDGIVKDDEGKAILEIKSVSGYKMSKLTKGKDDEDNISQALSYQMLLDDKEIKKSIVLYANKEPGARNPIDFFEKHYRLTKWREEKIRSEMKTLVGYWEKDEVPPCTCPAWMKNYNTYLPICQMNEKAVEKLAKGLGEDKKYVTSKKALYEVAGKERKEVAKAK